MKLFIACLLGIGSMEPQVQVNYSGEICAGDGSNQCAKMLQDKLDAAKAQQAIAKDAFLTCTNSK